MFPLIFQQLIVMLFIMIIGYVSFKTKLLNQSTNKAFSTFLLIVATPAMIIYAYQIDYDIRMSILLLYAFVAAILSQAIGILVTTLFIPKKNNPEFSIERLSGVYSNCSFMGIPLINATIGPEGVFFLSAYIAIFNLLLWTHGVSLLKDGFSMKQLRQGFLSPVFIATLLAIFLYFTRIRFPALLNDSLNMITVTVAPLAMMVAGISLAQANLRKIFIKFHIYKVAFLRLLLIPFLTLGVLVPLNLEPRVAFTILIASACPTATASVLMAIRYNKNHILASELFVSSTILGAITIPFVVFIAEFVL